MNDRTRPFLPTFALVLLALLTAPWGVASELGAKRVVELEEQLAELTRGWDEISGDSARMLEYDAMLARATDEIDTCIRSNDTELAALTEALNPSATSDEELSRQSLVYNALQDKLVECRVLKARVSGWRERLRASITAQRSYSLITGDRWWTSNRSAAELLEAVPWAALILLGSLPLLARRRVTAPEHHSDTMKRIVHVARCPILAAPAAVAAALLIYYGFIVPWPLGTMLPMAMLGTVAIGISDDLRLRPDQEGRGFHPGLVTVLILTALAFHPGNEWLDPLSKANAWDPISAAALLIAIIAVHQITRGIRGLFPGSPALTGALAVCLSANVIGALAWLGLRLDLAWYLSTGAFGTALALFAGYWLFDLTQTWLTSLDRGVSMFQQWLRRITVVKPGSTIPGIGWFRIAATVGIALGVITLIGESWRVEAFGIPNVGDLLLGGFRVGHVEFVAWDVFLGLLVFALLLAASQRVKRAISTQLVRSGVVGIRSADAVVTVLGYIGAILAGLIGLTIAGFSFGSLAVIAGALSVGIGFGLQNIVNNFISGVILLFERPIKPGDWIRVGDAEGLVTRVKVRSTEIQQFDRSELIVPNAELISGRVTNLTFHDAVGRLMIDIGVAYGSDVVKVRETLETVLAAHPNVIQDGRNAPKVLFWAFGDSSLDFQVRAYLRNVQAVLETRSELNFEIDRAFREADIEIPFPQRVVHLPEQAER